MHEDPPNINDPNSSSSKSLVEEYSPRDSQMGMEVNAEEFKCQMPELKYAEVDM